MILLRLRSNGLLLLHRLWGITTTGSNNGEINNLNIDTTWISLVTTAIADGSPTPVFCNSSYEHVYAYLYNGTTASAATIMYFQIGR